MTHRLDGSTFVVTVDPAWPPVSGADHRNWQIAQAAARRGPVRLLSVLGPADRQPAPETGITVASLSQAGASAVYCGPQDGSVIDLTIPPDVAPALAAEIDRLNPAVVILEHLGLHPLLSEFAQRPARLILDMHNVESDLVDRQTTGWRRWIGLGRRRAAKIRAIEQQVCATVDGVWVCSANDAARIAAICESGPRPWVVPNGIPRAELAPHHLAPRRVTEDGPCLLFIGHLGYAPNIVAAEILAQSILPVVQTQLPRSRIVLAGRNPHARVRRLGNEAITVLADPPDVAPLLEAADIAVIPLTMGSGTRIKIIEAMAWGVPVVASRLAAEGLDLVDGVHARLAETPRQFASAIAALCAEPSTYSAQREAAHAYAMERFGARANGDAVAAGLDAAATETARS